MPNDLHSNESLKTAWAKTTVPLQLATSPDQQTHTQYNITVGQYNITSSDDIILVHGPVAFYIYRDIDVNV